MIAALTACSENKNDKKAQLEKLKLEDAKLKTQISNLEAELSATDTTKKDKSKLVAVTEIKPNAFTHYIEVQARVEGDEDVNVTPETMGNVTAVLVQAGDHVTKGQVLATLDDKMIKQSMAEMESQLDLAKNLYQRQKNLWDQKIGSEVQFLTAKTNKESLEKRHAAVYQQWDMTRIKSPINGVVDNVNIKIGQSASPAVPAFRVVNMSDLKVKGEVAEAYIDKVKKGNDVLIYFPDLKKEIGAKVDYSGKVVSELNRTFNVEVHLDKTSGEYHPNMIAVLKIADYSNENAYVIPVSAVFKGTEGEYVFTASSEKGKNISRRKPVTSGITYNGIAEITNGLSSGDKVITTGNQNLVEGDEIRF